MGLLLAGPLSPAHGQVTCNVLGQVGGSFIGGGTTPFSVNATGKTNCKQLTKPDSTTQVEFGASIGTNTANCPGASNTEYPLVNGSFVFAQANSGSPSGTQTTTISGTLTPGSSFVCFDGPTNNGHFQGTVSGGSGAWAGASGTLTFDANGQILQSFGGGIVQISFTGALGGTIQHP
jgi:hypothetical protein